VEVIGQLIAKSVILYLMQKIKSSNAFDVPIIDVRELDAFKNKIRSISGKVDLGRELRT
jgi:hypothetical protein